MNTVYVLCFFLAVGLAIVRADEYNDNEEQYDEKPAAKAELSDVSDDKPQKIVEDPNTETSALASLEDEHDPDYIAHKGLCHHGIGAWFKPGALSRCNCLKCTCGLGGKWNCAYNFAYCPYYYCGNQIYNPLSQVCCCGKIYTKSSHYNCCGYFYYNIRVSKCCNYYSVKPKSKNCPRYQIKG